MTLTDSSKTSVATLAIRISNPRLTARSKHCARLARALHMLHVSANLWSTSTGLNKSKIAAFKEGLKDQVRDLLITVRPKPTHFDDFVKTCIEIDNAVHENELEKRHAKSGDASKNTNRSHPKQNQPSTGHGTATMSAPSSSTPTLPPGEPMMIDAIKTKCGLLTQAEHDCRRANKLCMYCGGQHQIDACPNMSDAAKKCLADKKRLADKKTTSPSLGKA